MANYTMTINEIINNGINIFNFEYELYDNTQKARLQNLFIHHYYFNEIGFETVAIWLYAFRTKWTEMLGKYNKLWIANNQDVNVNINAKTTRSNRTSQETKADNITTQSNENNALINQETNTTNSGTQAQSDIAITEKDFDYPSGITKSDGTTNFTNIYETKDNTQNILNRNDELASETNVIETIESLNTSQINAIDEYNQKLVDIDMQFIGEFSQLFMLIY